MSKTKKISTVKIFIFCFSLIIINNFCFPWIVMNGATGGYNEDTQSPGIQSKIPMEILLIEGAGYFLQTQSNVQTLLHIVELQDIKFIDYIELNKLVNSTLINIINARLAYEELIKVADITPYNLYVLEKLNKFDYETFMKEKGLNPYIFGTVRDYLVEGDITGTFKHAYINFKEIEQLLLNIQSSVLENRVPDLEILWRVNELCAEETLFGSYIARVFKTIK